MRVPASTLSLALRNGSSTICVRRVSTPLVICLAFASAALNAFGFDRIDYRLELRFHSWIPRIENGLFSLRVMGQLEAKVDTISRKLRTSSVHLVYLDKRPCANSKSCYSRCCIYIIYQPQSMD